MKLLAFETATEACSVAVYVDGEVHERFEVAPRRHAEWVLPWAEQLLAEAGIAKSQLDVIAVGRGPGAFTGVRLGVALAQGIALALDLPVAPVSTLMALAEDSPADGTAQNILAVIDARMGEIYAGCYQREHGQLITLAPERVLPPQMLELPQPGVWQALGSGLIAAEGILAQRLRAQLSSQNPQALPHAAAVARLGAMLHARGGTIAPERLAPAYLRDNVALTLNEQAALRAAKARTQ
ncbi:MAG: tRNA (adenosine(37)-N6)-threonylcarbamoyltransferase complex dimerization subunit type 1 TsaB [Xanthomonadaceae bacterium]|jgi:tRNA threonylcarbamoyladenosine biosynthesis protein TsaB|nr:tRNA (adenosine(37)-N6)-threonylcarbamoyltransferase complex dimerization subunit type 1 TsaB [Xanthomonadaceae bacterium]